MNDDKNDNENAENASSTNVNGDATSAQLPPRYAAYEMFGKMRSSTEEENELYNNMLERMSTPLGVNIFEIKQPSGEGKTPTIHVIERKVSNNPAATKQQANGIPLREETKYVFCDNGNICRVFAPDFAALREQREAEMTDEERAERERHRQNGEKAFIIPFSVLTSQITYHRMHAQLITLPPEVLQAELERVQQEIREKQVAQIIMHELGDVTEGDDFVPPDLEELLDGLDDEEDFYYNEDTENNNGNETDK